MCVCQCLCEKVEDENVKSQEKNQATVHLGIAEHREGGLQQVMVCENSNVAYGILTLHQTSSV